jgi:hypothetical protein
MAELAIAVDPDFALAQLALGQTAEFGRKPGKDIPS